MRLPLLLGMLALALAARAQQPALPGAPQPPAAVPGQPLASANDPALGGTYQVELRNGTQFRGVLTALSLENLEFDTQDLGHLVVARLNLVQLRSLNAPARVGLRPGYYDIGNGNRLFFGPTARNLRQGEGVVQDVWIYLAGINYGITDNISVGGYLSVLPGVAPQNQLLILTPKVSLPLRDDLHVAAGVLYMRIPDFDDGGFGVGLLYGALTSGSADNNVTVGLGYGFASGGVGSTPTLLLGGQRRISRKVSLLTENYIIANSEAGAFGLYGLKLNWRRTNLGIAAGYVLPFDRGRNDQVLYTSYIVPVYLDFSFRFGKPYRPAGRP
jgi:opacity protein-like surface antigen